MEAASLPYLLLVFSAILSVVCSFTTTTTTTTVAPVDCSTWREQVNEAGPRLFMVGDRSFVVPQTADEIDSVTCPRLKRAGESLTEVFRSCLRPFPRTLAALVIRKARRTMRSKCRDRQEKALIMHHLSCLRQSDRINLFHDIMDDYSKKLVYVQQNVSFKNMLDVSCCMYIDGRKKTKLIASRFCDPEAVVYAERLIDDLLQEALDLACSTYIKDDSKCTLVRERDPLPVNVTTSARDSFLLNLIDLLTLIGDNE